MPATYEPIATTTLGSAASSITFSSIPSTYTDLRLVLVSISTTFPQMRFNNDATALYSWTYVTGTGTAAQSGRFTSATEFYANTGQSATIPSLYTFDIFSYAGSTFKSFLNTQNNDKNGSGDVVAAVGLYRSTTAISRIDLLANIYGTTFSTGTTATLYGIKAA